MEEEVQVQTSEDKLDKNTKNELWSSRRKMAWLSLWGIIVPTMFIIYFVTDTKRLDALGDLMSWYYLSLASIVGAYAGFKSWAQIKGRGK